MMLKNIVFLLVVCIATARCDEEGLGKNEEYRCDVSCEKTCTNRDILFKCVSTEVCKNFCKIGYLRNEETGGCVKEEECPQCGVNETYKSQGIDCQTCENHTFVKCALINEYRCYCLPGYVRNKQGICTATEDCPKR